MPVPTMKIPIQGKGANYQWQLWNLYVPVPKSREIQIHQCMHDKNDFICVFNIDKSLTGEIQNEKWSA